MRRIGRRLKCGLVQPARYAVSIITQSLLGDSAMQCKLPHCEYEDAPRRETQYSRGFSAKPTLCNVIVWSRTPVHGLLTQQRYTFPTFGKNGRTTFLDSFVEALATILKPLKLSVFKVSGLLFSGKSCSTIKMTPSV
mmetsp:Transcript_42178/g.101845  ORF Transcript_42178/g.101845 Transcript_42178/m.101845 type:complete len:137 (-) Transcript_42178:2116-2526(-)